MMAAGGGCVSGFTSLLTHTCHADAPYRLGVDGEISINPNGVLVPDNNVSVYNAGLCQLMSCKCKNKRVCIPLTTLQVPLDY
jgi:hypothetical protein